MASFFENQARARRNSKLLVLLYLLVFFSSRRRHTRSTRDWSSDVCSSDLYGVPVLSTIAKGRVVSFDVRDARRVPGLIEILTPANALPLPKKGVHPELKDAPEIEIGRASCREVWKSVCAAW